MYELGVVAALTLRENYLKYRNVLDLKEFSKELLPVLRVLDQWHQSHNGDLDMEDLCYLFFAEVHHDTEFYRGVLNTLLNKDPRKESIKTLLESFKQQRLAEEISVTAFEVGEGKKTIQDLMKLTERLNKPLVDEKQLDFVTDDIDDILDNTSRKPGFRWRLKSLNTMLGSLRPGDFGYFFARPETGKTAMGLSEVTHFSTQLKEDQNPGIFFNNEEGGKKVKLKMIIAATGLTLEQIFANPKKAEELYRRVTHGKLLLVDNDNMTKRDVELYCETINPSFIVIDQLDKVQGFQNDREDLRLGAIYVWARGLAKRYGPVIGFSQADGTAEGVFYLSMAHVSNSKTSKAAEADWIVGIGCKNEPGYEYLRGLSICKNKLVGDADTDPRQRHGRIEVQIKPNLMRYVDI